MSEAVVETPDDVEACSVIKIATWRDFGDGINSVVGEIRGDSFVFRGQSNSKYMLRSSFDRRFGHLSPAQRLKTQQRLERIFAETAARNQIEAPSQSTARMCLGQHHGLATRMLDWSQSRYVAAFFAFSSLADMTYTSSLQAESEPADVAVSIFAMDRSSGLWSEDSVDILSVPYTPDNVRLRRQRGLFSVNHTQFDSIEEFIEDYMTRNPGEVDRTPLYRFDLPVREARRAIRDLHEMRVSHSELFPGLEGVAKEAMLAEWLGDLR